MERRNGLVAICPECGFAYELQEGKVVDLQECRSFVSAGKHNATSPYTIGGKVIRDL